MSTLSLCMIVKNEERNLDRCLDSVQGIADEIIIVDTGSNDQTIQIARQAGAQVFFFPWNDDFSAARNFSLTKASGDWILFLDADEELSANSKKLLPALLDTSQNEGYFIKIINYIGEGGWIECCPDLVFRLFRNHQTYRFHGAIHEQIADVILSENPQACFQIAEGVEIIHHGYLDKQIELQQKKSRNLSILQKELESQPDNLLLRYHHGVELFRAERYLEATLELILAARTLNRDTIYYPKLLRYIVLSQKAAGLPHDALESAKSGLALFPDYADLYYYAGLIHLDLKQYALARYHFQQAVSMPEQPLHFASFSGVRGFRSLYHLGQIHQCFLDDETALTYYLASLQANSNFIPSLESLTRLLNPRHDPEYASSCLKKAFDFSDPRASRVMGEILFRLEAYGLSLEYLQYSEQFLPQTSETRLQTAICLIQERRHFEALHILTSIPQDSPLHPLVLINRLLSSGLQGETVETQLIESEIYSQKLTPETTQVLSLLSSAFRQGALTPSPSPAPSSPSEANEESIRDWTPIELGPDGIALLLEITRRLVALREIKLTDFLIHSVTPRSLLQAPETLFILAEAYHGFGYPEHASQLLYILLGSCRRAPAHYLLAEILIQEGNYPRALRHYRWAIVAEPNEPQYYLKLKDLHHNWGLSYSENQPQPLVK